MSVYIGTAPNMIQFATWGGSGRSIVKGVILKEKEGWFYCKSTLLSSNLYIKGSRLSLLSLSK